MIDIKPLVILSQWLSPKVSRTMKFEEMQEKVLTDQDWLEKALLVLDENKLWLDKDQKDGPYLAGWVRGQLKAKVKLGKCLTSDYWAGRARAIVKDYSKQLLQLAYEKANKQAESFAEKAKQAKATAKALEKEIAKVVAAELKEITVP